MSSRPFRPIRVFESFRKSLNDLLDRATPPEERRAVAARMRDTLVQAKMGLGDLRDALVQSRKRLEAERQELETVRRRRALAEKIADHETVGIATKYEALHAERVDVLTRKVEAQEGELAIAEREVEEMSAELRAALSGAGTVPPSGIADAGATARRETEAALDPDGAIRDELDSLARARTRAEREAEAERRLEELKRRMGK